VSAIKSDGPPTVAILGRLHRIAIALHRIALPRGSTPEYGQDEDEDTSVAPILRRAGRSVWRRKTDMVDILGTCGSVDTQLYIPVHT
jgi:hypothetical protein